MIYVSLTILIILNILFAFYLFKILIDLKKQIESIEIPPFEEQKKVQKSLRDLIAAGETVATKIAEGLFEERVRAETAVKNLKDFNDKLLKNIDQAEKSVQLLEGYLQQTSAMPSSQKRYTEVIKLSNQGLSPDEISSKLSIPFGEVELLLRLNKVWVIFPLFY